MGEPQLRSETKSTFNQGKQLSPTVRMVGLAVGLTLVLALFLFAGVQIYETLTL